MNALRIVVYQGATWQLIATVTDSDDAPIDLSDTVIRLQARRTPQSDDVVVNLSSESGGGIELGPSTGQFTATLTPEQTAALPASFRGVYDVLVTYNATGNAFRDIAGEFWVEAAVTQVA